MTIYAILQKVTGVYLESWRMYTLKGNDLCHIGVAEDGVLHLGAIGEGVEDDRRVANTRGESL